MNDCYLNFLVSFRALFSLDVGANLVNSKQTIGIILPDLSLLGYAVPVESFGIGLFVILFAYLIIEYNVQLLSHEKFKIAMNMLHTAHTPLILLRNQLEELKTGNLPEPLSQQVEEALGYAECIIYCNRNIATLNKVNKRIPPKTSTVNLELSTYVTSIVNQCRAHANSRQIRLTVGECSDCVSCRINENIMTAALQHLINKMILISESGCCISINVTHTMNSWQLQISNNEIAGQRAGKMFPFIPIIFPVYGYSDLWTVRKIIRLHGGKITGCRHGKAATFQIVIPTDCHCQNQSCPVLKHSSAKTKTQIDDSCESPKSDKQNTKARETSHILLVMADKLFSDYLKESMTVLKDASSTAIYGSRAANGVVIMTSKKGKMGQKARVSINAQYGWSKMTGDNIEMMNTEQWLNLQEMLDPGKAYDTTFQKRKKFYIDNGISTDWADVFFGDAAPTQQYDVNVVGGSEGINYYISFGHYDTEGIMDDSSLRRETLRSNVEVKVTDWLKAGINVNLSYQKYNTTTFGTEANSVYNKAYAARIYRPDQTINEILTDEEGNFTGYGKRLDYFDDMGYYNPYYLAELQPNDRSTVRINGNTFFNINPIKGLNIRTSQAVDAFDYRNSHKAYPEGPFEGAGVASESFERYYSFTFTNTAEYKFSLSDKHLFTVLAGQESIITKNENFSATSKKMVDSRMMLMAAGAESEVPIHSMYDKVFNSYFGTISYSFADRYYVDLAARRDGSSLFAKNNQWANFYSLGAMWDMRKENFLQNVSWLNSLQLKVSYGTTGNSGISAYNALALVGSGLLYNGQPGIAPSTVGNDNLTWESMKTLNVGISTRVFDRFSVELEFYNRQTDDMLMGYPLSYTTGHGSSVENVASMRNRGFDITLGVDILKTRDFSWSVSGNLNYNKNEITKLFNGLDEYTLPDTGLKMKVGKPWGEYYYVRWAGVDPRDGYNTWYDKNGNLTKSYSEEDAVFVGKQRYAPWSGGFGTQFGWKGISVSADFSFMLGQYMLNNERFFTENPTFAGSDNQTVEMLTMWQKLGDVTRIATPDSPMQFDTHLLENASFMRMKNLTVGYTLPPKVIQKTGVISNARIYFVGRNLLTVTKYKGYDPEVDSNIQLGNYPNTKQYSFGVELTF